MQSQTAQTLQVGPGEFLGGLAAGMFAVFLLIGLAVLVLAVLMVVQAYKAGRSGWWIYLIALFISPFNLIAIIAWFAYLRNNPTKIGSITI